MFLADDSLLVREGVRALLAIAARPRGRRRGRGLRRAGARARMRPRPRSSSPTSGCRRTSRTRASRRPRRCASATPAPAWSILSQYDEPEYAIALLADGAAGYAYLLKDRVGDGDQLVRAVREVATGGSMLDPAIVQALVSPARDDGELDDAKRTSCCSGSPRAAR